MPLTHFILDLLLIKGFLFKNAFIKFQSQEQCLDSNTLWDLNKICKYYLMSITFQVETYLHTHIPFPNFLAH